MKKLEYYRKQLEKIYRECEKYKQENDCERTVEELVNFDRRTPRIKSKIRKLEKEKI